MRNGLVEKEADPEKWFRIGSRMGKTHGSIR
jgi:hypothetical protein